MTASALKHDHNVIVIKIVQSLKLFRCEEVASRKINRNKFGNIILFMQKAFTNFSNAQKKVFPAFSFQFYSTANCKFSFYISRCEINSIKIQTMSLVLN